MVLWRILGLLLLFIGVLLFVLAGPLLGSVVALAEQYLSTDHHITPVGVGFIRRGFSSCGSVLLVVGMATILLADRIHALRVRLFTCTPILIDRREGLTSFLVATAVGLVITLLYFAEGALSALSFLYGEDAVLEMLTAALFLVSAILLFTASFSLRRQRSKHLKPLVFAYGVIATVFLLFCLEEISWGQRIFGWETPHALAKINEQGEMNLHNLSNVLVHSLYRWGVVVLTATTFAGWFLCFRGRLRNLGLLFPHPAMIGLVLLVFFFAVLFPQGELVEELGAILALLYALRSLKFSRS